MCVCVPIRCRFSKYSDTLYGDRTIRFPAFTHAVCSGLYEIASESITTSCYDAVTRKRHFCLSVCICCHCDSHQKALKRIWSRWTVPLHRTAHPSLTLFIFFSYFWQDSEAVWNGWVFFHSIQCVTLHRMCFEMIERINRVYMWKWFIWHVENGKRWVNRLRNSEERVANWVKR